MPLEVKDGEDLADDSIGKTFRAMSKSAERAPQRLACLAVCLLAGAVTALLDAYGLKLGLDAVEFMDASLFLRGAAIFIVGSAIGSVCGGANSKLRVSLMESAAINQRTTLMAVAMSVPLLEFDKTPRGDILSRITSDTAESSRIFTSVWYVVDTLLKAVFASIYMMFISWKVGVPVIVLSAGVIFATRRLGVPVVGLSKAYRDSLGHMSTRALNILEGRVPIKVFLASRQMESHFEERSTETFASWLKVARRGWLNQACSTALGFSSFLATFAIGGYLASTGQMSLGGILAVVHLTDYLGPLAGLGQWITEANGSVGAHRRLLEFSDSRIAHSDEVGLDVEKPVEIAKDSSGVAAASAREPDVAVEISELTFEYEPGRLVLGGLDLKIPSGLRVAVVGRSGSGKSTFLKIMAGLYPPTTGSVKVLGMPLHTADGLESRIAKSLVAYTPQEPFLFSGTVRENLLIAREDSSDDELMRALGLASADGFVHDLPMGMDEEVGERGSRLSGGQRQRLSVARSFLKHPPLLLLDEPTGTLDESSESALLAGLARLPAVTSIIVTHRREVARACDLILVLDDGAIREAGTHDELVEREGLYASLFRTMTEGSR